MNIRHTLLPAALFLAALTPAFSKDEVDLAKCPAPVQETIRQNLDGGKLDEIKIVAVEGRTLYVAEIERPGPNDDRKVYVAGDGKLLKVRDEIELKAAPAAVQEAAQKLAGTTGKVDDIDKEVAEGKTTYRVEIDRHAKDARDLKVVFSEDGTIISQRED